jgi:uncharacterized membrane protein (UPF0127 family)
MRVKMWYCMSNFRVFLSIVFVVNLNIVAAQAGKPLLQQSNRGEY